MAELDPAVIMETLLKQAEQKRLTQRLNVPEFEKDQLRVDKLVTENNGLLSGMNVPDRAEQLETGRQIRQRLDDAGRVTGNPFGVGDVGEALGGSLKTFAEGVLEGNIRKGEGSFEQNLVQSKAATEAAKKRLGGLGDVLSTGGEIGAMIAMAPASAGLIGAGLAGAAEGLLTETANKMFKEDRPPTLAEAMTSTTVGLGLGGFGQLMGNRLTRWLTQKGAAKTPITAGAERALKATTAKLSRAFRLADDSEAVVQAPSLLKFVADAKNNTRFQDMGLDPNIDHAAWNGLNVINAEVTRAAKQGQGLTIRELATIRTKMRDVAARGDSYSTELMAEMDNAFAKSVDRALVNDPKAKTAWAMIGKVEKQKIQGEWLTKIADDAELHSAAGKGPIDKFIQDAFLKATTTNKGRSTMVKLGFSPEAKELFRDIAHGSKATVLANKVDRVAGNTILAPVYRLTLQPIFRARGGAEMDENLLQILGYSMDDVRMPATTTGAGQVTAPMIPPAAEAAQNALGLPGPGAGQVQPSQAPMPMPAAPNDQTQTGGAPQRMPRPLTPQSQSAVPKLPSPK